jgi:hypothetical protein
VKRAHSYSCVGVIKQETNADNSDVFNLVTYLIRKVVFRGKGGGVSYRIHGYPTQRRLLYGR